MQNAAIIRLYDESGFRLGAFFKKTEGTPDELGKQLANMVKLWPIGTASQENHAHGMGCLAALVCQDFKRKPADFYIVGPKAKNLEEAYEYQLRFRGAQQTAELHVYEVSYEDRDGEDGRRLKLVWKGDPASYLIPAEPQAEPAAKPTKEERKTAKRDAKVKEGAAALAAQA